MLTLPRVAAAAIALGLTTIINILLHSSHLPAGATTLLFALGAFSTLTDALKVVVGVVLIGVIGEAFRCIREQKPSKQS